MGKSLKGASAIFILVKGASEWDVWLQSWEEKVDEQDDEIEVLDDSVELLSLSFETFFEYFSCSS